MSILMIVSTQVLRVSSVILIAVQLAACGNIATSAPTATATTLPSLTPSVVPTSTESPPTPSSTSTPSSIPLSSPPDGLHMAYIDDGNLYFQDGSNPPIQLTYSGEDSAPIFSDDGEKIAFSRGVNPFNLYSINVDGSSEQALVTPSRLINSNLGNNNSTSAFGRTFLPGTHLLLFRTFQTQEGTFPIGNSDLLVVDTDTAELKRILPTGHVGAFYVSPDGGLIAIDTIGQVDVIDIGGRIIHQNLLTYTPSEPTFLPPGIFWMPDSTGLIVVLPVPTFYEGNYPPDYTVWRYTLDGSPGVQISLDPPPSDHNMAKVSPDGNWIIYNNYEQNAFYIGNLRTGHTELYESQHYVHHYDWSWSPNSKHFIYMTAGKTLYLGSTTSSPALIGRGGFLGWADSSHYLYYADKTIVLGEIGGEAKVIFTGAHEFFQDKTVFTFILP